MAIKSNFTVGDFTYADAYLTIRKITTGHSDEEYFVPHPEYPEWGDVMRFQRVVETKAFVYVYGNKEARDSGVAPVYAYGFDFHYDIESGGNIYKEAYEALKSSPRLQESLFEDC